MSLQRLSTSLIKWQNSISGFVARSLSGKLEDTLNVKDFGAKGDYDTSKDNGNDTQAFADCLAYIASFGTRRTGGRLCIRVPAGVYKVDRIQLKALLGFGVEFVGDGLFTTCIRFDHAIDEPAIDSEIEFVAFSDMSIMGTLKDSNTSSDLWRQCMYRGRLANKNADIDVKFTRCNFFGFKEGIQAYGRGVVVDGCVSGFVTDLISIMTDNTLNWVADSPVNAVDTGARHYTVRNTRFDQGNSVIKVSGDGAWRDYINDVLITNNDFFGMNSIIQATDATIRRFLVSSNTGLYSCRDGWLVGKSFIQGQVVNNNISRGYNDFYATTNSNLTCYGIVRSTGVLSHVLIQGNSLRYLRGNLVECTGNANNITISNNDVVQAWVLGNVQDNHYIFFSPNNCALLVISDNQFSASATSGSYHTFGAAQVSKLTTVRGNVAPWKWTTYNLTYQPVMSGGGTQTSYGRWGVDGDRAWIEFMITVGTATATTGLVTISLPPGITSVPMNNTITPSYSGGGVPSHIQGFTPSVAGQDFRLRVNPQTNVIEVTEGIFAAPVPLSFARRTSDTLAVFGRVEFTV